MNIILCGFQTVGKTYCGKRVSKKLGCAFFDVDEELLKKNNALFTSIRDFCLKVGEEEFRRQEAEVVAELCQKKEAVIALGGGSLVNKESQQLITQTGRLIYLYVPYAELYKRLQQAPLPSYLPNKEAFEKVFTERHAIFSQLAMETIFLQEHATNQIIDKISSFY